MTQQDLDVFHAIIERYKRRNPKEWEDWKLLRDKLRAELRDQKFGTNEDEAMRHVANVPAELDKVLRTTATLVLNQPDYLTKDFLKAFPVFKIADKM